MAATAPSPIFERLVNVWRHLSLRSDVDEIILELLGRFSLERIYCDAGDKETYQHLVIGLLAQLNVIFFIQRLTLPAENAQAGRYLGLFVSWEVALRSVELVLQAVADGRELLWECRRLRDRYLAEFLLSALRILALHPRGVTIQRVKDRRDRFARVHKSLEQVFDSYPGEKSFLLLLCKEVTAQLHTDPSALGLPQRLRHELPNLTAELYPLAECLSPRYIQELVPEGNVSDNWLSQFLTLRDMSHFVVGAAVECAVHQEAHDAGLQTSAADTRDAILHALQNLRLPPRLSRRDLLATFNETFRTVLSDTLDLAASDSVESAADECELDALDSLSAKLNERQIIHRVSDVEMMRSVSQVIKEALDHDSPSDQFEKPRPGLYVLDCQQCHFIGASQLRASKVPLPTDFATTLINLPPQTKCPQCRQDVVMAREVPLVRRAWEVLGQLEVDADTINVERHLPSQFQIGPPRVEADALFNSGYSHVFNPGEQRSFDPGRLAQSRRYSPPSPVSPDRTHTISQVLSSPQQSLGFFQANDTLRTQRSRQGSTTYVGSIEQDQQSQEMIPPQPNPTPSPEPKRSSQDGLYQRKGETPADKGKSKWRLPFSSAKKPPAGASGDSSSLSSTVQENQRLEEISMSSLVGGQKASGRGKHHKIINAHISQNSTLALFWTQQSIQIWNVEASPPTMRRSISTESTCILATVAKSHLAYMIGTRDQKLTLRIASLAHPSNPAVEYRMPSSQWCKSMAIDMNENYVVVGFENSMVRFFKTANAEQPREDRLHGLQHQDCRACPPVDTLSFSSDGLALLASTRNYKTGIIQAYLWRFPFLAFHELTSCRYTVPLHESEDNGISAALFRPGAEGEDNLVCITTWTQSGTPVLAQPRGGHRSAIRTETSSRGGKLGNRIQCATFSPSGRELAMVNDRGHVYQVSNLNSSPMDIRRISTSRELTAKSGSFSMAFMTLGEDESIVLAWADSSKATGWIKKIPVSPRIREVNIPETPGVVYVKPPSTAKDHSSTEAVDIPQSPVELSADHVVKELDASDQSPAPDDPKKHSNRSRSFFDYR